MPVNRKRFVMKWGGVGEKEGGGGGWVLCVSEGQKKKKGGGAGQGEGGEWTRLGDCD